MKKSSLSLTDRVMSDLLFLKASGGVLGCTRLTTSSCRMTDRYALPAETERARIEIPKLAHSLNAISSPLGACEETPFAFSHCAAKCGSTGAEVADPRGH